MDQILQFIDRVLPVLWQGTIITLQLASVSLVLGIGALIGAIVAGQLVRRIRTGTLVIAVLLVISIGMMAVALAPNLTWALVGVLMDVRLIPAFDLGYRWFNATIFPLFSIFAS